MRELKHCIKRTASKLLSKPTKHRIGDWLYQILSAGGLSSDSVFDRLGYWGFFGHLKKLYRDLDQGRVIPIGTHAGQTYLIFTMQAASYVYHLELILALALQLRGAKVLFVICDRCLTACEPLDSSMSASEARSACQYCYFKAKRGTQAVGCQVLWLSELVPRQRRSDLQRLVADLTIDDALEYERNGIQHGRIAETTAVKFLKQGQLGDSMAEQLVFRRFLHSSLVAEEAARRAISIAQPTCAIITHGIYSSFEPPLEVCKQAGIPAAVYDRVMQRHRYQFNWNVPPQIGGISAVWSERSKAPPTPEERAAGLAYLESRRDFSRESVSYTFTKRSQTRSEILEELRIPADAKIIALFANLLWDASSVGYEIIFESSVKWIEESLRLFALCPDSSVYWVIKPHPAEALRGTRLSVTEVASRQFDVLPDNIRILPAKNTIHSYSFLEAVDAGIVHTSTAGLELAGLGKPVIVVGRAHYRGKGFTLDPESYEEYVALIQEPYHIFEFMTPERQDKALHYIHLYFDKHQIPIPVFEEPSFPRITKINPTCAADLLPGNYRGLDVVCDVLLDRNREFILP